MGRVAGMLGSEAGGAGRVELIVWLCSLDETVRVELE